MIEIIRRSLWNFLDEEVDLDKGARGAQCKKDGVSVRCHKRKEIRVFCRGADDEFLQRVIISRPQ